MPKLDCKIGFIGAGNMSEAMTGALVRANIVSPAQIHASDTREDRLALFQKDFGIRTASRNIDVAEAADILIFAVKPQILAQVLEEMRSAGAFTGKNRKILVSIAAGFPIRKLENIIYKDMNTEDQENLPIIRVMPNTPCLVMAGMSGMCANRFTTEPDLEVARTLLSSMGTVIQCDESDMDAVTALSGSGPAYVFYFVEAMIAAGIRMGLPEDTARTLSMETFKGAMKLLDDRGEKPDVLRKNVTSPGGTTEAAITAMEKSEVKEHFIAAITRAAERSRELSGM